MGLSEKAKEGRRLYMKKYRERNRERVREYQRKYMQKYRADQKHKKHENDFWERKAEELKDA